MSLVFRLLVIILSISVNIAHAGEFTVTSTAAEEQGALAVIYTCDGKNISPEIAWSNVPAKTKTFALIMSDPDAPNGVFYHWVLFNLPRDTHSLPEGLVEYPAGSVVGINSWGKTNYSGPCPPKGSNHHYVFTLYALDKKLSLSEAADAKALQTAMTHHVIAAAEFVAVYTRWIE